MFTDGQMESFNSVVISDNQTLVLDPITFAKLDTADVLVPWSSHDGVTVVNGDGTSPSF